VTFIIYTYVLKHRYILMHESNSQILLVQTVLLSSTFLCIFHAPLSITYYEMHVSMTSFGVSMALILIAKVWNLTLYACNHKFLYIGFHAKFILFI
jgi:hypothetical protein